MPYVPPWLDVSPRDFVTAAQGGARIGAEIAGQRNEAGIAAGRNSTSLQEAQMRINAEAAAQSQAAQQSAAERALREWELKQQILHQTAQLQGENQRNQNTIDAENQRAAAALLERQQYGNSMLDIRRQANEIAKQKADAAAAKPSAEDLTTVSEHTPAITPHDQYVVNEPGTPPSWFGLKSGTPPTTLTTTNSDDLLGLPKGSTIVTNKIPGAPSITTTRKIPALTLPDQQKQSARVIIKDKSGKRFSIPEDQLQDAKAQGYTEVK